jgi:hypothetical protein
VGEADDSWPGRTWSPSWCRDSISPRKRLRMPETWENGLGSTNTMTLRLLVGSSALTALALAVEALDVFVALHRTVRLPNAGRSATSTLHRLDSSCGNPKPGDGVSSWHASAKKVPGEDLRMPPHCGARWN